MLTGTADPLSLPTTIATLDEFTTGAAELGGVTLLQALFEIRLGGRETTLPPGLHPTNPPTCVIHVLTATDTPWGPMSLAQVRVGCRSGLRPRGFALVTVTDNEAASAGLGRRWGFGCEPGTIALRRRYDQTTASVTLAGGQQLSLSGRDPEPLAPGDVSYSDTLNLANTPNGLRLVQIEADFDIDRVERIRPRISYVTPGWPHPDLDPYHPVSATVAVGSMVLQPLRFVCRPDVLAFEGTESVTPTLLRGER